MVTNIKIFRALYCLSVTGWSTVQSAMFELVFNSCQWHNHFIYFSASKNVVGDSNFALTSRKTRAFIFKQTLVSSFTTNRGNLKSHTIMMMNSDNIYDKVCIKSIGRMP